MTYSKPSSSAVIGWNLCQKQIKLLKAWSVPSKDELYELLKLNIDFQNALCKYVGHKIKYANEAVLIGALLCIP